MLALPKKSKDQLQNSIGDTPNYTLENLRLLLGFKNLESVRRLGRNGKIPGRIPEIRQHLYVRQVVDNWILGQQQKEATGGEQHQDPESSLKIEIRETGDTAADPQNGKAGKLVAFTLGNYSNNVLTVERICLEVLSCQSYDEPPHIEARVIPIKYEIKLAPDRQGEYVVTEERFRYEGPSADDFDLVCSSLPGFKYNIRLGISYGDLATNKHFNIYSEAFDLYFYKESNTLSRYIHEEHARRLNNSSNRKR